MRKRGIPVAVVRAVMSFFEGAKTRVRVGLESSLLLLLVFAIVVDMVRESVRNGFMSEMLYMEDLLLTSEMMEGLRERFSKWKEAFNSKELKVNLGKTKVVVSGAEGLSIRK